MCSSHMIPCICQLVLSRCCNTTYIVMTFLFLKPMETSSIKFLGLFLNQLASEKVHVFRSTDMLDIKLQSLSQFVNMCSWGYAFVQRL
jgi:hypothetical protein